MQEHEKAVSGLKKKSIDNYNNSSEAASIKAANMSHKETFSIHELHYLSIGAFDGELMPGLPTLDDIVTASEVI